MVIVRLEISAYRFAVLLGAVCRTELGASGTRALALSALDTGRAGEVAETAAAVGGEQILAHRLPAVLAGIEVGRANALALEAALIGTTRSAAGAAVLCIELEVGADLLLSGLAVDQDRGGALGAVGGARARGRLAGQSIATGLAALRAVAVVGGQVDAHVTAQRELTVLAAAHPLHAVSAGGTGVAALSAVIAISEVVDALVAAPLRVLHRAGAGTRLAGSSSLAGETTSTAVSVTDAGVNAGAVALNEGVAANTLPAPAHVIIGAARAALTAVIGRVLEVSTLLETRETTGTEAGTAHALALVAHQVLGADHTAFTAVLGVVLEVHAFALRGFAGGAEVGAFLVRAHALALVALLLAEARDTTATAIQFVVLKVHAGSATHVGGIRRALAHAVGADAVVSTVTTAGTAVVRVRACVDALALAVDLSLRQSLGLHSQCGDLLDIGGGIGGRASTVTTVAAGFGLEEGGGHIDLVQGAEDEVVKADTEAVDAALIREAGATLLTAVVEASLEADAATFQPDVTRSLGRTRALTLEALARREARVGAETAVIYIGHEIDALGDISLADLADGFGLGASAGTVAARVSTVALLIAGTAVRGVGLGADAVGSTGREVLGLAHALAHVAGLRGGAALATGSTVLGVGLHVDAALITRLQGRLAAALA